MATDDQKIRKIAASLDDASRQMSIEMRRGKRSPMKISGISILHG